MHLNKKLKIKQLRLILENLYMFDMNEVEVSANWACGDAKQLKNLVTFIESDNKKYDIENVIPETCVCLEKEENDDSKPELSIKVKDSIKEIVIFSEGSLIEVFGVHDEYLFTITPEFLDDWEGLAVYQARFIIPEINTCKLKFTRIKESGRLWIYSVQLSVTKTEEISSNTLFNFENVNKLISNSSQGVSEKADKFRRFFESYAEKNSKTQPFSVQSLFKIINRECNVQLSDCKRTVVECLNSASLLNCNENLTGGRNGNTVNKNEFSLENQYLKSYIDRKFIEMKEDIIKHVDIKLSELRLENRTALDQITKLLESSKT